MGSRFASLCNKNAVTVKYSTGKTTTKECVKIIWCVFHEDLIGTCVCMSDIPSLYRFVLSTCIVQVSVCGNHVPFFHVTCNHFVWKIQHKYSHEYHQGWLHIPMLSVFKCQTNLGSAWDWEGVYVGKMLQCTSGLACLVVSIAVGLPESFPQAPAHCRWMGPIRRLRRAGGAGGAAEQVVVFLRDLLSLLS